MVKSLDELVAAARSEGPASIAVAAGQDPDVLQALKQAQSMGLAEGILVGDRSRMEPMVEQVGLELASDRLIHEPDQAQAAKKAIALIREGRASLLMKGKINTSTLIRAVLDRETGLRTGRLLSQVIVFQVPGIQRLMVMTDAAINIAPNLAQKAEICRNAIEVAHAIGVAKPNLAALCALEFVNPEMPATLDAAGLTLMNRRGPDLGSLYRRAHCPGFSLEPVCCRAKGHRQPAGGSHRHFPGPRYRGGQHPLPRHSLLCPGRIGGHRPGSPGPAHPAFPGRDARNQDPIHRTGRSGWQGRGRLRRLSRTGKDV